MREVLQATSHKHFLSKSAYGEPAAFLVLPNMETEDVMAEQNN